MRRTIRLLVGLGVLGVALWLGSAWLLSPGLWAITSSQAVVNARILTLRSPIEGVIATSPPAVGKAVAAEQILLRIDNQLVDKSRLEELRTECAYLAERLAALRKEHETLEALKQDLTEKARRYHESAVRRLESQVAEAGSQAAIADTFLRQRNFKQEQLQKLFGDRTVSQLERVTSELATEAAQYKAAQTKAVMRRLHEELESTRKGNYIGPGDARNDVPYSQQRSHEIDIRQQEIVAKIREYSVQHTQVQQQVRIENQRLERQSSFALKAPIDGIIWRLPVAAGSAVNRDTDLLQLLDASDIFVDGLVNEKYFGDIQPGDKVVIRLIGSHTKVGGTVKDVLGQVVSGDNHSLAAEVPKLGKHEIRVLVAFDQNQPKADNFHPYHIGQPVEIRFENSAGFFKRVWDLVMP